MDTAIELGPDSVDSFLQVELEQTDAMDEALRYLSTEVFNDLKNLLENSQLYSLKEVG